MIKLSNGDSLVDREYIEGKQLTLEQRVLILETELNKIKDIMENYINS